jgi:hypothetical protein
VHASRVVVTALGAALAVAAIALVWTTTGADDHSEVGRTFVVRDVTVVVHDDVVTLRGGVPTPIDRDALVDSIAAREDVTAVVDHLRVDETAASPPESSFHTGLDALRDDPG